MPAAFIISSEEKTPETSEPVGDNGQPAETAASQSETVANTENAPVVVNDEKRVEEEKKPQETAGSEMPESEIPASEILAESEDPGEAAEEQGFVKRNNEKPLIPADFFYDFDIRRLKIAK